MANSTEAIPAFPAISWSDLEAVFDDLAITPIEKEAVAHLLSITRLLSCHLSPLDLMREIICIAFVLTSESDRSPARRRSRLRQTAAPEPSG